MKQQRRITNEIWKGNTKIKNGWCWQRVQKKTANDADNKTNTLGG